MQTGLIWNIKSAHALMSAKIGHFVLIKPLLAGHPHQLLKHIAGQLLLHIKLPGLELLVQRRVLFVDHLVAGKMFRLHGNGLAQRFLPHRHGLRWDGKHQIQIHPFKARIAENVV